MTMHWDPGVERSSSQARCVPAVADNSASIISVSQMDIGDSVAEVVISIVGSSSERNRACSLINDRYGPMGYGSGHLIPTGINRTTFTAQVDGEVVATLTLAADSLEGLAADKTFKEEVDLYRRPEGAVVCELAKFAFKAKVHSKKLMATMFHVALVYGQRVFGGTDLLIEVNRRHTLFYTAMLDFKPIGVPKLNKSVGVPIQLMHLEVSKIRSYIDQAAGNIDPKSHSLYPFFLSVDEELIIANRLYGDRSAVC